MNHFAQALLAAAPLRLLAVLATTSAALLSFSIDARANGGMSPKVVAGGAHVCALADNGTVKCWGSNESGQLGTGNTDASGAPVPIAGVTASSGGGDVPATPVLKKVSALAASTAATCAVSTDSNIWCWGSNAYGELGQGTADADPHPTPVLIAGSKGYYAIVAGANHFCAASWEGVLSCWGSNSQGQTGNGAVGGSVLAPANVPGIANFKSFAAGAEFSCANLAATKVKCWGANDKGQLGGGVAGPSSGQPLEVPALKDAYEIVAGANHVCALTWSEVALRCWGDNSLGQLAQNTLGETAPRGLSDVAGLHEVQIVGGTANSTCAVAKVVTAATAKPVSKDSYLNCWGDNSSGQLGTGDQTSSGTPRIVNLAEVAELSTGSSAATQCAIVRGGTTHCWGNGTLAPAAVAGLDLVTKPQYPNWSYIEPVSKLKVVGSRWRIASKVTVEPSSFVFPQAACKGKIAGDAFYYKKLRKKKDAKKSGGDGAEYKKVGVRTIGRLRLSGDVCKAQFVHKIPLAKFAGKRKKMRISATGFGNAVQSKFTTNEFEFKYINKHFKKK